MKTAIDDDGTPEPVVPDEFADAFGAEPAGVSTRVSGVLRAIRHMILTGELLPGEQLRQDQLAKRLDASRIPVREALMTLASEGVVTHTPHAGFTVKKFSRAEISEIYLMRRLLEAELLRSVDLERVDLEALRTLNDNLADVSGETLLWRRKYYNRRFHFLLFDMSPLAIIREQVERLWNMSEYARSLYAYDGTSHDRIVTEHTRIVQAVADRDTEALVQASEEHRANAERLILQRIR
ncbi:MAG: GntR family transcriptional regulator [Streptosporangiales bacterium]|nr:GntR family transcriptional regulator [Streptosporangiales bacterium]